MKQNSLPDHYEQRFSRDDVLSFFEKRFPKGIPVPISWKLGMSIVFVFLILTIVATIAGIVVVVTFFSRSISLQEPNMFLTGLFYTCLMPLLLPFIYLWFAIIKSNIAIYTKSRSAEGIYELLLAQGKISTASIKKIENSENETVVTYEFVSVKGENMLLTFTISGIIMLPNSKRIRYLFTSIFDEVVSVPILK